MLKKITAMWKNDSMMRDIIRKLAQMVADSEYIYTHAWEVCTGQAVADKTESPLREHDGEVNRGEREIRRLILEHLSINPGRDLSGCLAVMIMAKDVERVGDHSRNMFGTGSRYEGNISDLPLFDQMNAIQKSIGELLPKLQRAILDSSEVLAHEILASYQKIKVRIKDLQDALFKAEMTVPQAIVSALLTRTLMRLNAHIGNAASGIVFPLQNIDFVSRGLREEEETN